MRYRNLAVAVLATSLSLLANNAAFADEGRQEVVDFSGDPEDVDTVAVLPDEDIEFQPLMPKRYSKRKDLSGDVPEFEDPLPLKPQRRGCGACSSAGRSPGPGTLLVLGALWLGLCTRRKRRHCSRDLL